MALLPLSPTANALPPTYADAANRDWTHESAIVHRERVPERVKCPLPGFVLPSCAAGLPEAELQRTWRCTISATGRSIPIGHPRGPSRRGGRAVPRCPGTRRPMRTPWPRPNWRRDDRELDLDHAQRASAEAAHVPIGPDLGHRLPAPPPANSLCGEVAGHDTVDRLKACPKRFARRDDALFGRHRTERQRFWRSGGEPDHRRVGHFLIFEMADTGGRLHAVRCRPRGARRVNARRNEPIDDRARCPQQPGASSRRCPTTASSLVMLGSEDPADNNNVRSAHAGVY